MCDSFTTLAILFIIFCFGMIFITSSRNKRLGKSTSIVFRYIDGMPQLKEGTIIEISKDKESINIDNKYFIANDKIISKTITNSKILTDVQKSVIQRSLVGVMVAGPLGAIVGGISGVGTKKGIELVHFLNLNYIDEDNIERKALFAMEDSSKLLNLTMLTRGQQKG